MESNERGGRNVTLGIAALVLGGCGHPPPARYEISPFISHAGAMVDATFGGSVDLCPMPVYTTTSTEGVRRADCHVYEVGPPGTDCASLPGRHPKRDALGRPVTHVDSAGEQLTVCEVDQLAVQGSVPPAGNGWFFDTTLDPQTGCAQRVRYAAGSAPPMGTVMSLDLLEDTRGWTRLGDPASNAPQPMGARCNPRRAPTNVPERDAGEGHSMFDGTTVFADQEAPECGDGVCLVYHY